MSEMTLNEEVAVVVMGLVEKWRKRARNEFGLRDLHREHQNTWHHHNMQAYTFDKCADQLEAVLSAVREARK